VKDGFNDRVGFGRKIMEKPKRLLVHRKIPANTACPFADECKYKAEGTCNHRGKAHECEFSCALARLFDLVKNDSKDGS
jgi:hypothetical protein